MVTYILPPCIRRRLEQVCLNSTGEEYEKILAETKSFLPFLKTILETDELGIQKEHQAKLRSLYDMVDKRRLALNFDFSPLIVQTCSIHD